MERNFINKRDFDAKALMKRTRRIRGARCWLWTGAVSSRGYGNVHWRGRMRQVHRVMFEVSRCILLEDQELVLHTCDRATCIYPGHLYVGTHRMNARDREMRGRSARLPVTQEECDRMLEIHHDRVRASKRRILVLERQKQLLRLGSP